MTHRVVQLSDTHFLEAGAEPEGGYAYDTAQAFAAVEADIAASLERAERGIAFVAVTGDVTDHGRPEQYRVAAEALARLELPVIACPGNHDRHVEFGLLARPGVATSRVVHTGNWCHLFVDSNAAVLIRDEAGNLADPDSYDERLYLDGGLGKGETAWVRAQAELTDAAHVFVWLHHPPAPPLGPAVDLDYEQEWLDLASQLPKLRGMAAGHTHIPTQYEFSGIPVFVAPSLKSNLDPEARTLLPPGYRVLDFHPDGRVESELRMIDDPRWPRHRYGRAVHSLLTRQIGWEEFEQIVIRKQAEAQAAKAAKAAGADRA